MSVYVDPETRCRPKGRYRWNTVTHLFADTVEELNRFAGQIGMKREWFQVSRAGLPHYDLNHTRRKVAIECGAIPLSRASALDMMGDVERFPAVSGSAGKRKS